MTLVPAHAVDLMDLYFGVQTWSMRFGGYRNYRIPVKIPSGETCVVALTAHVNPKVEKFSLLLHGFGDSRFSWWKWIEKYEDHPIYSSFIALDWPQHGQTRCDSVEQWSDIVDVIRQALRGFEKEVGDRDIYRLIGQSLGVVPTALLSEHFPSAQQVWLTPPFLQPEILRTLSAELMDIDTPVKVQVFMNRVLTEDREIPDFLRAEMLERIKKAQRVLQKTSLTEMDSKIFRKRYNNLVIVAGAKDELVPLAEFDSRVAKLSPRPVEAVPCGHDILRHCGEEVKILLEGARYLPNSGRDEP